MTLSNCACASCRKLVTIPAPADLSLLTARIGSVIYFKIQKFAQAQVGQIQCRPVGALGDVILQELHSVRDLVLRQSQFHGFQERPALVIGRHGGGQVVGVGLQRFVQAAESFKNFAAQKPAGRLMAWSGGVEQVGAV